MRLSTPARSPADLGRLKDRRRERPLREERRETARRCAGLPPLDNRSTDEIVGYDESGLPRRWGRELGLLIHKAGIDVVSVDAEQVGEEARDPRAR